MQELLVQLAGWALLVGLWAVFIWQYRKDPRRLGLAALLFPLALFSVAAVLDLLSTLVPGFGFLIAIVMVLTPLIVLIFGGALVYNGVLMWRREGARISNLLSLAAGVLVLILPVLAVLLVQLNTWWSYSLAFILFMVSVFTACLFAMMLLYAWVHAKFQAKTLGAAAVILGARTINGKVTPLLRGRLDKAIELYASQTEPQLLMVPTGGQGHDEQEPEGVSMARYLREQGIPAEQILVEDRAKDTIENLKFSDSLVRERQAEGKLWLVTSDYHALRAALASRQMGLEARAYGGKTAAYYRPSAFLRECVAIARDQLKLMILLALPFALSLAGLIFLTTRAGV